MHVLTSRILCVTMLSLQLACSTAALPPAVQREHYDPAYLNEAAIAAVAAGERGTAVILLERAVVLAPQDALIRQNLAALRRGGVVRIMPTAVPIGPPPVSALKPTATPASASASATAIEPTAAPLSAETQAPAAAPSTGNARDTMLPPMGIWPLK